MTADDVRLWAVDVLVTELRERARSRAVSLERCCRIAKDFDTLCHTSKAQLAAELSATLHALHAQGWLRRRGRPRMWYVMAPKSKRQPMIH